jgi:hypothetical protein
MRQPLFIAMVTVMALTCSLPASGTLSTHDAEHRNFGHKLDQWSSNMEYQDDLSVLERLALIFHPDKKTPQFDEAVKRLKAPLNELTQSASVKSIRHAPFGPGRPTQCLGQLDQEPDVGWYFDPDTGDVWAASDDCARTDTFAWTR